MNLPLQSGYEREHTLATILSSNPHRRLNFAGQDGVVLNYTRFALIATLYTASSHGQKAGGTTWAGRVLNSEGRAPESGAMLRLDCPGEEDREAHADSRGWFRFDMTGGRPGPLPFRHGGTAAFSASPAAVCDLAISAPGYRSRTVPVHAISAGIENVGIVYLNRQAPTLPARVSILQLQIPPKARQAYNRGQRVLNRGDVRGASAYFERAARTYPNFAGAWIAKGQCDLLERRFDHAQLAFEKAMSADPQSALAVYGAALAAMGSGQLDAAASLAERLIYSPSGFTEHLYLLAVIRISQARSTEGVRLLKGYLAQPAAKNRTAAERILQALTVPQRLRSFGDPLEGQAQK